MFPGVDLHVLYKVANSLVLPFPFPHMHVPDIFPADFYAAMRANLPPKEAMQSLKGMGRVGKKYPDTRFVLPLTADHLKELPEPMREFWAGVSRWMLNAAFANLMMNKFGDTVYARVGDPARRKFFHEVMLVQDYSTYFLGPHTDGVHKVLSLLFYLPADDKRPHLGTSLYVPKDGKFRCRGGPHYKYEPFHRVYTMSYLPNTLFAFPKSDHSFHGVEPITDTDVRRDLLLYDVLVADPG